jgi:hypothetical protein
VSKRVSYCEQIVILVIGISRDVVLCVGCGESVAEGIVGIGLGIADNSINIKNAWTIKFTDHALKLFLIFGGGFIAFFFVICKAEHNKF